MFVSYSRQDSEFALQLVQDLKRAGAAVWLDQLELVGGMRWDAEVEAALSGCSSFLVILTPISVASENVRDEIAFAISHKKNILPVLWKECDVPFRLARFQHVDFRYDYREGLAQLLKTIEIKSGQPASNPVSTPSVAELPAEVVKHPRDTSGAPHSARAAFPPNGGEPNTGQSSDRVTPAPKPVSLPDSPAIERVPVPSKLQRSPGLFGMPQGWSTLARVAVIAVLWQASFGLAIFIWNRSGTRDIIGWTGFKNVILFLSDDFGLPLTLALRWFWPRFPLKVIALLSLVWLLKAFGAYEAFVMGPGPLTYPVIYTLVTTLLVGTFTGSSLAIMLGWTKEKGLWLGFFSFAFSAFVAHNLVMSGHPHPSLMFVIGLIAECAAGWSLLWTRPDSD